MKAPKLAPAPITVSDRTCEAVFGVGWRTLRPFLVEKNVAIHKIGRRSIVRVDHVLGVLGGEPVAKSKPYDEDAVIARAAGLSR